MDLDGGFQRGVMVNLDIGVSPADMREDHCVLATLAQRRIKIRDGVRVILYLVAGFDQRMRTAPECAALICIDDVAVPADRGIA